MNYVQEDYAKDLHSDLTNLFANSVPATSITIDGVGVHWNCNATRGNNSILTNCFDSHGPEYLTSFERESKKIASGRTSSKYETLKAIEIWLQGKSLSTLYDRFRFVDERKRELVSINDDMLAFIPELAQSGTNNLHHIVSDFYSLCFRVADRSCEVSYSYNDDGNYPGAVFHWDECPLFQFPVSDRDRLAVVLKRWLCDRAMPSVMRTEFPEIEIGELADYYERGNPIEGEFIKSWERIDRFYDQFTYPFMPKIHKLIAALREKGYHNTLRAGQSMLSLVVSRSRRHGLKDGQPGIAFSFHNNGMDVCSFKQKRKIKYRDIEFIPEIEALLNDLVAMDIN